MTPAAISIRGLDVRRGRTTVLEHIDVEIAPGRITGLLGPSGSGKTTLLRTIVGVQRVSAGEVDVLGRPAGTASLRTKVAYTTQATSVYTDLTVTQNVAYFASLVSAPKSRVDEAIETVGLTRHADRMAGSLSGGELSRVSIACALVGRPEVLILDEPTVGLDPVLRRELWDEFAGLARDGVTVLVSSHVMDEAARCDDLVLLRDGRVLATGSPDELLARTGAATVEDAFLALVEHAAPEPEGRVS